MNNWQINKRFKIDSRHNAWTVYATDNSIWRLKRCFVFSVLLSSVPSTEHLLCLMRKNFFPAEKKLLNYSSIIEVWKENSLNLIIENDLDIVSRFLYFARSFFRSFLSFSTILPLYECAFVVCVFQFMIFIEVKQVFFYCFFK